MATIKPLVNYSGIIKESQTGDVVGVANGGTGATTLTAHGVLIGNGTSAIAATSAGTSGQVLTSNGASADPTFQAPAMPSTYVGQCIASVKTSDQTVTSSTTLVDCTGLSFAIGANETWKMQMDFHANALGTAGMKWKFTVPSGCTAYGNGTASRNANGFQSVNINLTTGASGTTVMGDQDIYGITGYIVNSSTAGTVQFQFAQGASNATGTTIDAYSCLTAIRVA